MNKWRQKKGKWKESEEWYKVECSGEIKCKRWRKVRESVNIKKNDLILKKLYENWKEKW